MFKSEKDGLLLCDNFIGFKPAFASPYVITNLDFMKTPINWMKKFPQINNCNVNLGSEELTKYLYHLKKLLIVEDSNLASEYEEFVSAALNDIELNIAGN